jgi:hypothetical protein
MEYEYESSGFFIINFILMQISVVTFMYYKRIFADTIISSEYIDFILHNNIEYKEF